MPARKTIISFLIFCNLIAFGIFYDLRTVENFRVVFFDVGQGDAALIRTAKRQTILIDGGPEQAILPHLAREIPFWEKKIDLIILTHPDADHLSGLVEVLQRYDVKQVLWNGQEADTLLYKQWKSLIQDIPSRYAFRGQKVYFSGGRLDVLYPPKDYQFSDDLNEGSIINKLIHSNGKILYTGDAYKAQESKLLSWEKDCQNNNFYWCDVMDLSADVLKVGHHGSSSSSDALFLSRVKPKIALISAGQDNRYGHPHQETLNLLKTLDISIHQTSEDGNLIINFD